MSPQYNNDQFLYNNNFNLLNFFKLMYNSVDSFVGKLHQITPQTGAGKNFEKKKLLEKVFLNNKNTFGRYQVLPMNSVISDFAFVNLYGTREINIPRKNVSNDGTESTYNAWIRLLPKSGYTMKDPSTGREISSLTASDETLLAQAYEVFDQLYNELDVRNNASDPTVYKLIRKRNYTIFHGYCVNMWGQDGARKPVRQNFSALFVLTSKAFLGKVEDNIEETSLTSANGQTDWTSAIYNRSLSDREGYLMFNINKGANPGFDVSVSHQLNAKSYLAGVNIPEEDAELMSSPVESFLGWQANRDNETPVAERRLFNAKLITEAIEYMTNQLARIRIAKQQGGSIAEAIESTNQMILNSQVPTNNMGQATNDPILVQQAEMASKESTNRNQTTNAEAVIAKNNDPQNPAAAHLDPITGAPVAESSNFGNSNFGRGWNTPETADDTFQKPSFAGGNGQNLPF